jgi:uncharacterized membrane protein
MAAVTYATRASGLWVGSRLRITPRLERVFDALPGAILVSLVAPAVARAGIPGLVGAGAATLVAVRWRGNIVLPMVVGVVVLRAVRLI